MGSDVELQEASAQNRRSALIGAVGARIAPTAHRLPLLPASEIGRRASRSASPIFSGPLAGMRD